MNHYPNTPANQILPNMDLYRQIFDRLAREPELVQTLNLLYHRVIQSNPGQKFTRYAKKEVREQPKTEKTERTGANECEVRNVEIVVDYSNEKAMTHEPEPEKQVECVIDNYRKVVDKFVELQTQIKPSKCLAQFKKVPILNLAQKAAIEEMKVRKQRSTSFN